MTSVTTGMSYFWPTSRRISRSVLAHPLEAVRASTRFERPAAQDVRRATGLHVLGDGVHHLVVLRRARPGDHREATSADLYLADVNGAVLFVELAAGEFERLEDGEHLLDAGNRGEVLGARLRFVADDADDGAAFTA